MIATQNRCDKVAGDFEKRIHAAPSNLTEYKIIVLGQQLQQVDSGLVVPEVLTKRAESASNLFYSLFPGNENHIGLLLTGGDAKGVGISESEVMRTLLTQSVQNQTLTCHALSGKNFTFEVQSAPNCELVSSYDILIEHTSEYTWANALYSLNVTNATSWILVTSQFHMPRAKYTFDCVVNQAGVSTVESPCLNVDPLLVSTLNDDIFTMSMISTPTFKPDTNQFNNVEKVIWEYRLMKSGLVQDDLKNQAGITDVFERCPISNDTYEEYERLKLYYESLASEVHEDLLKYKGKTIQEWLQDSNSSDDDSNSTKIITISLSCFGITSLLLILFGIYYWKKQNKSRSYSMSYNAINDDPAVSGTS